MKIISFSSHSSIWTFAFAEAIIASALLKRGHDVLYITPGKEFVRKSSTQNEKILREEFHLKGYGIGHVLTKKERQEIQKLLNGLTKDNFENLKVDGIDIGRIAMYEFLIKTKKMSLRHLNESEWVECQEEIKNTLVSYFACRLICEKEKPDRIIMYNNLYSVNRVWEIYAESKGIPTYFLHHGVNMSDMANTLIVARRSTTPYIDELKAIWAQVKEIPTTGKALSYVSEHFLALLEARNPFVYSSPKSDTPTRIRIFFNVGDRQKIIVATMSSYDELFAAEYTGARDKPHNLIFSSQAEWIGALIDYIKNKPELFLIIRVHPREFPNKRDGMKSDHAKMLEHILKGLPDNVKINWPADNISLYDLATEADLFLNGWSSAGAEMSLLGIPVVIYSSELISYPPDLNYLAQNRADYFEKIEQALQDGWGYERMKKTFRWMALYYYRTIMRLREREGESVQTKGHGPLLTKKIFLYYLIPSKIRHFLSGVRRSRRLRIESQNQFGKQIDISGVERMLIRSSKTLVNTEDILADQATEIEENLAIRAEVQKLYKALFKHKTVRENTIRPYNLEYNLKRVIE